MKKIDNFSNYGITSCGKVWSYTSNKFIKAYKSKGYWFYQMYNDQGQKISMPAHRCVALAYLSNPQNLRTVDHIDGNPDHNYLSNLQWMNDKDNITKSQGKKIRCIELNLEFPSQTAAAEYMGCCHQNISNCLRGRIKTACGYHWEAI